MRIGLAPGVAISRDGLRGSGGPHAAPRPQPGLDAGYGAGGGSNGGRGGAGCAVSPRGSGRAGSSRGAPEPAHADNGRSATRRGGRGATPSGQGRIPTGDRPSAAALSRANRTTTRGEEEAPPPSRDSPRTLDGLSRRAPEAEWASEWWVRGVGRGTRRQRGSRAAGRQGRPPGSGAHGAARCEKRGRAPSARERRRGAYGARCCARAALLAGSGRGCVGLPRAGEGEAREGLGSDGWCALAALCAAVRGRCSSLRGGGRLGPGRRHGCQRRTSAAVV